MSWIGLYDKAAPVGVMAANGLPIAGLDRDASVPGSRLDPDTPMATGTLLVEFEIEPLGVRQNLIRYAAREPWHSSLTLCIDPDGSLRLLLGQSDQSFAAVLPLPLGQARQRVIVSFVWDGPARFAVLSARLPDIGHSTLTEVRNPLPLGYRDVDRILTDRVLCQIAPEVLFAAFADSCEPVGPNACLGANAVIDTPDGPRAVATLRPGDLVDTADGDISQVRWVGFQDLPARGSFAPHLIRSPYYNLTRDLTLAPDQQIRLTGSEIEYTFGQEAVFASVRHLADGVSILRPMVGPVVRYWQVLLDRHTVMKVSGAELESLDPAPFLSDPSRLRHSLLRNLPRELIPRSTRLLMPSLRAYEAHRLSH